MSETVHGTAMLAGSHGVLLRGASGAGKSQLALLLIERGARLIADDRVHLSACHGRLIAAAPASIAGKIELRGRGILEVPYERTAVIQLIVDIVEDTELERMADEGALFATLLGVSLTRQPVAGAGNAAILLVEAALRALSHKQNIGLRSAQLWG
jgi:serine kinase of HPr protein (carbohydrate metabolism regulator)